MGYDCLITASTILNCLVSHKNPDRVYLYTLKRLFSSSEEYNIKFYITDFDFLSSFFVPLMYNLTDQNNCFNILSEIYNLISKDLHIISTNSILEKASYYQSYGPLDAIRIATAIDHHLMILTVDASHYAYNPIYNLNDVKLYQNGGSFFIDKEEDLDTGDFTNKYLDVFNVNFFTSYLVEQKKIEFDVPIDGPIRLESYRISCSPEENNICVTVSCMKQQVTLSHTISCTSLIGAFLSAIESCVKKLYYLPRSSIMWQALPVKDPSINSEIFVCIEVENNLFYSALSSEKSVLLASGYAYIEAVNRIIFNQKLKHR